MDVWGLYEEGTDVAVQLFVIRGGNIVDRRELFWEKVADYRPGYFLSEILQRYYQDNLFIPPDVLIPFDADDKELLDDWLTTQARRKVQVRGSAARTRGSISSSSAIATRGLSHESRFRKSTQDRLQIAASRLGEILGLGDRDLQKIESFDISNIQGTDSVAGMVVLDRGKFDKNQYRIFNIKTVIGADDFAPWPRRWTAGIGVWWRRASRCRT